VLEDHGHLEPGGGRLPGPGDVDRHPVTLAVVVGVERSLHVDPLFDRVGEGENRLGHPVLDDDGRRRGGRRRRHGGGRGQHQPTGDGCAGEKQMSSFRHENPRSVHL
jgi:hypothetical protein